MLSPTNLDQTGNEVLLEANIEVVSNNHSREQQDYFPDQKPDQKNISMPNPAY
ncbi:MAG: hypothetical protein NC211_07685 [Alistipes senegalensis]|nr:hypothetical protein [Oxalobacter formigenes]MCM1281689.1 hypothetical protein [Alistipes senegalensis]